MDDALVEKLRRWEPSGGTWTFCAAPARTPSLNSAPAPVSPMERLSSSNREPWTT